MSAFILLFLPSITANAMTKIYFGIITSFHFSFFFVMHLPTLVVKVLSYELRSRPSTTATTSTSITTTITTTATTPTSITTTITTTATTTFLQLRPRPRPLHTVKGSACRARFNLCNRNLLKFCAILFVGNNGTLRQR